ncbi:hypothetical protein CROQUDRAFT_726592 [Cronartium quercuum f. sp. fusiforme G11]|uniref:Uncharacterized protein n=1 Tax=Cronartium quercuum f. sp. fusiforme G11 TaxID=708437 RepID=A0A9P6T6F9_9BASI|nr:hypothetical protein CROQUDRAFT_726592 [Cronartium quercuum f. sp. fusiforme G11]
MEKYEKTRNRLFKEIDTNFAALHEKHPLQKMHAYIKDGVQHESQKTILVLDHALRVLIQEETKIEGQAAEDGNVKITKQSEGKIVQKGKKSKNSNQGYMNRNKKAIRNKSKANLKGASEEPEFLHKKFWEIIGQLHNLQLQKLNEVLRTWKTSEYHENWGTPIIIR